MTNIFFVFYVRSFENLYQRSAAFDVFFNDCTFICCWWSATTLFLKKKDNFFLFFPRWISKIKLAMFQGPSSTMLTFLGKIQKASHNNEFYLKDYFGPFSCFTSDYFLASIFFWNRIESDVIQKKPYKKPSKIKCANKLLFFSKIVLFCCKKIRFSISYKKLGLPRHKATANIFGSL